MLKKDIAQREGFLGLWRGNGVMMARGRWYAGVSFSLPEVRKPRRVGRGARVRGGDW